MRSNGRKKRRIPTDGLDARNPSWSPNGQRLVFQGCERDSECADDSIFVVGRRGGRLRQIAAEGEDPVWAPNGRWIVDYLLAPFAWSPEGDRLLWRDDRGTFVARPDGRGGRRIAGAEGGGGDYAWQPLP